MTEGDSQVEWIERLLDLALYAPVGAALALRSDLPKHVKQGRQAFENRVQLARFIGQLTVQTGRRELRRRFEERREPHVGSPRPGDDAAGPDASSCADSSPSDDGARLEPTGPAGSPAEREAVVVPGVDELPISDYENLPAINVVERLRTMQPAEIELIRLFETAHRARRTVLAKVDQLQQRQLAAGTGGELARGQR